jgi:hypothetical protein
MSTNDNSCCPVWPSISPYNGGPFPTRLWSRAVPNCVLGFTQEQLDMRRKAEILQYNKNGGHLTKKQQWSRAMRGHGPVRRKGWATQSQDYTDPNTSNLPLVGYTLDCSGGDRPCNPVGASDVPGSGVLCLDRNVPVTGLVVQRQYLAGGTKWPQTTTGDLIVPQYASCPSDPATWLDISYPPELSPTADGSVSTNVLTVCAGDYDYLCVILGRKTTYDASSSDPSGTTAPSYTATITVNSSEIDAMGAYVVGGGGAGAATVLGSGGAILGPGGGGGGGIVAEYDKATGGGDLLGRTITVNVGQGGIPYNSYATGSFVNGSSGSGGDTSVSVSGTSWSVTGGGGMGGDGNYVYAQAEGGRVDYTEGNGEQLQQLRRGGDGGTADPSGAPLSTVSPTQGRHHTLTLNGADNYAPSPVWQATAVEQLEYTSYQTAGGTNPPADSTPFSGGGNAGLVYNGTETRFPSVAKQNDIHNIADPFTRAALSGTVTPTTFPGPDPVIPQSWGAGGVGGPYYYNSPVTDWRNLAYGGIGGIGGNGLVILWFRHESPCR